MPPALGWATIGGVVVAYDVWALRKEQETLSACWRRLQLTPAGKVALPVVWLGLTWHLLAGGRPVLPDRHRQWYQRFHPVYRICELFTIR